MRGIDNTMAKKIFLDNIKKRHHKTLPISRDVDCSGGMAKKRGAQRKKLSQEKVLDTAAKKNT